MSQRSNATLGMLYSRRTHQSYRNPEKFAVNSSYQQLTHVAGSRQRSVRPLPKAQFDGLSVETVYNEELTPRVPSKRPVAWVRPVQRNGCWREVAPAAVSPTFRCNELSHDAARAHRNVWAPQRAAGPIDDAFIGTTTRRCSCADRGRGPRASLRVRRAVAPESTSDLREAVCAYVDAERARAEPAERIIVSMKAIAERARVTASRSRRASPLSMSDRDELLTRAVTWCIERYYQTGQARQ